MNYIPANYSCYPPSTSQLTLAISVPRSRSPGGASPLCRGRLVGDAELPPARRGFGMPAAALAGGAWQHPAGAGSGDPVGDPTKPSQVWWTYGIFIWDYILSYVWIYTWIRYMDYGFIHGWLDMDLYMDYSTHGLQLYGLQAMVSIGFHMLCASHGMIELFFSDRVVISPFVIMSPGLFHVYIYI